MCKTRSAEGADIRYSMSEDEGYSTAGPKWARDNGILSKADVARFWEAIANISKRGYYTPRSERGEYIIESGNKLIFTDGDFKAPQVSRVIVFNDTFEDTMAFAKAVIYDEERYSTERGETLRIVKDVFGDAYAVEYTNTDHSFHAR